MVPLDPDDSEHILDKEQLVFVINNVCKSYEDLSFWVEALRDSVDADCGPYFVLFTEWVRPQSALLIPKNMAWITVPLDRRLGMRPYAKEVEPSAVSLALTADEVKETAGRFGLTLEPGAVAEIVQVASGHAGIVNAMLRGLRRPYKVSERATV